MFKFMTRCTKPKYVQWLRIIWMMTMNFGFPITTKTVLWSLNNTFLYRLFENLFCLNFFRILLMPKTYNFFLRCISYSSILTIPLSIIGRILISPFIHLCTHAFLTGTSKSTISSPKITEGLDNITFYTPFHVMMISA